MIININQFKLGCKNYVNDFFNAKGLEDKKFIRFLISSAVRFVMNEFDAIIDKVKENKIFQLLNLIDENNMMNVDNIFKALSDGLEDMGGEFEITIPFVKMERTINKNELECLYKYIEQVATTNG